MRRLLLLVLILAACSSRDDTASVTTREASSIVTASTTPAACRSALDAVDQYIVDRTAGKVIAKPDSFGQCRYNAATPTSCVDAIRVAADLVDTTTTETFNSAVVPYRAAAAACRQQLN